MSPKNSSFSLWMEPWKPLIEEPKKTCDFNERNGKKLPCFHSWFWTIVLIWGAFLFIFCAHQELYYRIPVPYTTTTDRTLPEEKTGFLVHTPGCRIPDLDPFDPAVLQFIRKQKDLECYKDHPVLVEANLTSIFILKSAFQNFNITNEERLDCCYQPLWRSTDYKEGDKMDNKITFSDNCTPFKGAATIQEEFVKVICKVDNQVIYKNYHAFIPTKPEVEKRCEGAKQNLSSNTQDRLSVLIIGMDGVSRINLHRQMPKTVKKLQEMEGIELLGYNKLADNTYPNIIPVLSGLPEKELERACSWKNNYFDDCNWIWKKYSAAGYRTVFGEDTVELGLFAFLKPGFKYQPTDYYIRPYMKAAEDELGYKKQMYTKLCVGSEMSIAVLLRYISNYAETMSNKDSFGFFWGTSLTHDYLNYPSLGDDLYEQFLNKLINSGSLSNTLLIFMSDHGIRWGGIRETYQGRLEERLPFVIFMFPKWFKEKYPEAIANLRQNTRRLTTSYDFHQTLSDVLEPERLDQASLIRRSAKLDEAEKKPRGISLFLPIGTSRTCEEAGIDKHWCTCQRSKSLPKDDSVSVNMSSILVEHLNTLLQPFGECSKLELAEVKSATVEFPLEHLAKSSKDKGIKDYILVVRTTPGDGLFEATIRQHAGNNSAGVTGTVSRINTYGDQSACVSDFHMKLYCYCKSLIQDTTNLR